MSTTGVPLTTPGGAQHAPPGVPLRERYERARRSLRESSASMTVSARVLTWSFGILAGLAVWLVAFGLVLSTLVESHAQSGLYQQFRTELAGGVAPLGGQIARGSPVALLSSHDAGLDNLVAVEGTSSADLRDGPGHRPGTVLPGQAGVSVMFGRSTSFGAPFGGLAGLHAGSTIVATTGQGRFTFVVQDVRRPGDPLPVPLAAGKSRLTLVTAAGGGWRAGWAPQYAIYVDADLRGSAVAAQAPADLPSERDGALARDTDGMYPLVLWLQLLLVAAVGGCWLRARAGLAHAWLLAVPVGLAALWGASQEAWLLLPNLL